MEIMETIKFLMMCGLEVIVVAIAGVTLLAGVYQFVRDKIRQARASTPAVVPETANH